MKSDKAGYESVSVELALKLVKVAKRVFLRYSMAPIGIPMTVRVSKTEITVSLKSELSYMRTAKDPQPRVIHYYWMKDRPGYLILI